MARTHKNPIGTVINWCHNTRRDDGDASAKKYLTLGEMKFLLSFLETPKGVSSLLDRSIVQILAHRRGGKKIERDLT